MEINNQSANVVPNMENPEPVTLVLGALEKADNDFKVKVCSSGKIIRANAELTYSSTKLVNSLVRVGMSIEAAIHIPFQIIPWLVELVNDTNPPRMVTTQDIRAAVLRALNSLIGQGIDPHLVMIWSSAYMKRFGDPDREYIKILDHGHEYDLDYSYIKSHILPHLFSRIIGLTGFQNPVDIYPEVFSSTVITEMQKEIMFIVSAQNVYTIRYKTVLHLLEDTILEPPHPWIVNEATMRKVTLYNIERAAHHYKDITSTKRANAAYFNQSARECFMHIGAAILANYGAFLGVGGKYGMRELARILKLRHRNPSMWDYCRISQMEYDLRRRGISLEYFAKKIGNANALLESIDSQSKFDRMSKSAALLMDVARSIVPGVAEDMQTASSGYGESKMTNINVFISHSSRDTDIARCLINLVKTALNIPPSNIRCTSVDGYRLPVGATVSDELRREILDCGAFVALITPNSMESAFVLFELGARWGARKPFVPLLARGASSKHLKGPLSSMNALDISQHGQVQQLIDDLANILNMSTERAAVYHGAVEEIVKIATAGAA